MAFYYFATHRTALEIWRHALCRGMPLQASSHQMPPSGYLRKADIRILENLLENDFPDGSFSQPLHLTIRSRSRPTANKKITVHSCSNAIPRTSIWQLNRDVCLSSPPLAFVQIASSESIVDLMKLAFELCGTYSTTPGSQTAFDLPPLTTVAELRAFASRHTAMHGARKAGAALRYVCNRSASPRESCLVLALCLPTVHGGAGIALPCMDYEVRCSEEARAISGRSTLRCDLCWPEAKLDVEYQSQTYHEGEESRIRDSRRTNALIAMGFTVIQVTNKELESLADFNVIAGNIKKQLGIYPRIRATRYHDKQITLRRQLGLPVCFG